MLEKAHLWSAASDSAVTVAVNLSFRVKGNNMLPKSSLSELSNPNTPKVSSCHYEEGKKSKSKN